MEYFTTPEVAVIEGVTTTVAHTFAKKHGVRRLADRFLWTREDLDAFRDRNKTKGRPKK